MTLPISLPSRAQIKARARRLCASSDGSLSHSQALEQIAHDNGFRDWNTLSAALDAPPVNVHNPRFFGIRPQ